MTEYTLKRAESCPSLLEMANGEWRRKLSSQDRHKIRVHMTAMMQRCFVSRYSLRLSDLAVIDYTIEMEKNAYDSAVNEVDYFTLLLFRLSRLIGLRDAVEVVPATYPVHDLLHFPELNHTPIPYCFPEDRVEPISWDESFNEVFLWVTSLRQYGHFILEEKAICVMNKEIDAIIREMDAPFSGRKADLSKRSQEIRNMKRSLQQIDATLHAVPDDDYDDNARLKLEEFLKAYLFEKATYKGIELPFKIGNGLVHHCFYSELISIADVWVDYKLRA